ncbi:hypothetical protein NM688_g7373 [Phlebia brevispora]|uniref:Uncharacterized protein n=1 Tax=Phlebia brevispora TaxID=194682 RepID=A0ACC1S5W7_9APHY|nr:hypothetical protein NM688_g7373 [Phlebia brevispora]
MATEAPAQRVSSFPRVPTSSSSYVSNDTTSCHPSATMPTVEGGNPTSQRESASQSNTEMLETRTEATSDPWPALMPKHWEPPEGRFGRFFFFILCLGSLEHHSMNHVWEACREEDSFTAHKERVMKRLKTISLEAGLLLAALAAFITTTPPLSYALDYNERASYIFLGWSLSCTLGAVVICSANLWILSETNRLWFRNILAATRLNLCCFLLLMCLPSLLIVIATNTAAFGLLIAALASQDIVVQVGGTVFLLTVLAISSSAYTWLFWAALHWHEDPKMPTENGVNGSALSNV